MVQSFGYIVSRQEENLEKLVAQGKIEGKRKEYQVEQHTGQSLSMATQIVKERDTQGSIVAEGSQTFRHEGGSRDDKVYFRKF